MYGQRGPSFAGRLGPARSVPGWGATGGVGGGGRAPAPSPSQGSAKLLPTQQPHSTRRWPPAPTPLSSWLPPPTRCRRQPSTHYHRDRLREPYDYRYAAATASATATANVARHCHRGRLARGPDGGGAAAATACRGRCSPLLRFSPRAARRPAVVHHGRHWDAVHGHAVNNRPSPSEAAVYHIRGGVARQPAGATAAASWLAVRGPPRLTAPAGPVDKDHRHSRDRTRHAAAAAVIGAAVRPAPPAPAPTHPPRPPNPPHPPTPRPHPVTLGDGHTGRERQGMAAARQAGHRQGRRRRWPLSL